MVLFAAPILAPHVLVEVQTKSQVIHLMAVILALPTGKSSDDLADVLIERGSAPPSMMRAA